MDRALLRLPLAQIRQKHQAGGASNRLPMRQRAGISIPAAPYSWSWRGMRLGALRDHQPRSALGAHPRQAIIGLAFVVVTLVPGPAGPRVSGSVQASGLLAARCTALAVCHIGMLSVFYPAFG